MLCAKIRLHLDRTREHLTPLNPYYYVLSVLGVMPCYSVASNMILIYGTSSPAGIKQL